MHLFKLNLVLLVKLISESDPHWVPYDCELRK